MATYAYRASDKQGNRKRGTISAASGRHARQQLRTQGLTIESVKERQSTTPSPVSQYARNRSTRYRSQLTIAVRELATLLQAGVPLLDALDSILTQSRGGFRDAMLSVRDKVASGESLGNAMASERHIFDEMIIGMIGVGEHVGNLDEVCEQVAEFRERSNELKDRVVSAMLYPAIIFAVSIAVTVFLMTAVVPMLLQNLVEIGRPLPTPTLVLKWLSDTLLDHGIWVCSATALLAASLLGYSMTAKGRRKLDEIILSTPVLGTLVQKQALSRIAIVISTLLRSGVELVDALEIAERSSTNGLLKSALAEMQFDLRNGKNLLEATERHRIISRAMCQVFLLGQQSGQLDTMLSRLGRDYSRQAELLANRLTTIVEPVLLLFLSVVVGFILFATVLPIMEAGNVLAG
ncbi:Type II secretion system protein F [Stieleria neptunia]|uniref:General secretion pathway protein F n=1 Tax=Stieleria neptunia TaxID=2527979 RepID=A0A518HP20_9BACT|nr:type II secretion system F family protein [Stieleria neptunia]QDV42571.1 Type II secretion system protein F [Stieleria neptunia]